MVPMKIRDLLGQLDVSLSPPECLLLSKSIFFSSSGITSCKVKLQTMSVKIHSLLD